MTHTDAHSAHRHTVRGRITTDTNRPLPHDGPTECSASDAAEAANAGMGSERDEAVEQLADALRTAERAHRAYLAELRLGDVEPADDWSTWYAEYLLGQRS